jgi:hypothetical protein
MRLESPQGLNRMRTIWILAASAFALAACGGPAPAAKAPVLASAAASNDDQLTVEQLQAKAAAAEADAKRLEAQAGQAAAAPAAAPAASGSIAGTLTLGAGDETLHSGQYYKTIPIPMNPGDVYQVNYTTHGYAPLIVVLDQNKQPFSQSTGGPQPGQPLTTEIRPDKAGTWYLLLSALTPGASGTFEVNIQKITETPLQ